LLRFELAKDFKIILEKVLSDILRLCAKEIKMLLLRGGKKFLDIESTKLQNFMLIWKM
jgi:hypothetical protein